jgi:hypothetical protein
MQYSDITEMVDDLLDSEGDVVIGSLTFSRSYIVKRLDPIAYREICNDVVSSQIEDLQYDLDRLDPELDADEIADIKERIEDLEGAF